MSGTEGRTAIDRSRAGIRLLVWAGAVGLNFAQGLPPVPVPPENPITEEKRVLGKILFWDDQVSGNSTVACGTCHSPGRSGTDGRIGIHPGSDATFGTIDDVRGSSGVVHVDADGIPIQDPLFGLGVQVTRRSANTAIGAAYAPEMFWDGRARTTFLDPSTGEVSVATGGALENQALGPILSSVEMGRDPRTWAQVTAKLMVSEPMGRATALPADVSAAVASHTTYPELFQAAFGDPTITAERIAYAVATYERTLVANQTPWDAFVGGNPGALTPGQQQGWNFFRNSPCAACHTPPLFTNHTFRNIGVRPPAEDLGRQEVTGLEQDRGRFKVPTLRGAGLKTTFMHNGSLATLQDVLAFYRPNNPARFTDNLDPIVIPGVPVPPNVQPAVIDFLANGLTDPRVVGQTFPFDRPTLHGAAFDQLGFDGSKTTLRWPPLAGVSSYALVRGDLADLVDTNQDGLPDLGFGACVSGSDPNPADGVFVDPEMPESGAGYFYLKGVVEGGNVRGLGVTSAGRPRVPAAPCP